MNKFDDSFDERHELEAPLRSLRPRVPDLDVDRLLEELHATTDDPQSAMKTSIASRSWLSVVGVWSCGAIVGGLAVFLLMQNRIESMQSARRGTSREIEATSNDPAESIETGSRENGLPAPKPVDYLTPESSFAPARFATFLDGPHGITPSFRNAGSASVLTAGSHFRSLADRSSVLDRDVMPVPAPRANRRKFRMNTEYLHPPATRATLLAELLSS